MVVLMLNVAGFCFEIIQNQMSDNLIILLMDYLKC